MTRHSEHASVREGSNPRGSAPGLATTGAPTPPERPWPRRELRYCGQRWQWVISTEQVAIWHGPMTDLFGVHRTVVNLRIEAAWRALTGKDER